MRSVFIAESAGASWRLRDEERAEERPWCGISKPGRLGRAPRQGFTGTRGIPRGRASAARAAAAASPRSLLPAPRSPLPPPLPRGTRSHQPLVGGAPAPANVSPAVFCVFQNRGVLAPAGAPSSGRLCLHARRLAKSAAASLAVLRRVVMVTPGEKSTRRGPQRADKGLGGEACGPPALLMFNLELESERRSASLLGPTQGVPTPARDPRPGCMGSPVGPCTMHSSVLPRWAGLSLEVRLK